jgi:hypothetical protein
MMLAVGAGILASSPAFAGLTPLPAGSSGVTISQTDTFLGDVGAGYHVLYAYQVNVSNGPGLTSATLYADVIQTAGGTIDMAYQVTNTSSTATIDSMTLSDYSGIGVTSGVSVAGLDDPTAPLGTNFAMPTSPANPPNTAGRTSAPGAQISFTFSSVTLGDILPGMTSGIVLVTTPVNFYDTNGAAIVASTSTVIGSVGYNNVPEVRLTPVAVPEPGSMVLGSLALICGAGVYGFRRIRRK